MKLRIAGTVNDSIVDGPGLRFTVFFRDDECCVEYHPAKKDYVNFCDTCLHIWRPQNETLPTPPKIYV